MEYYAFLMARRKTAKSSGAFGCSRSESDGVLFDLLTNLVDPFTCVAVNLGV